MSRLRGFPRISGMGPMTPKKLGTRTAAAAGIGSLGVLVEALARISAAHPVPAGIWAVMIGLVVVTATVSGLALILDYRVKKLEIELAAALRRSRQEMYRAVLEQAAGDPASAVIYRELIVADALHLSAERNDARPPVSGRPANPELDLAN